MNIREELVRYGKLLHEKELVIGAGGNISACAGDEVLIKRRGIDMSRGTEEDYLSVMKSAEVVEDPELSTETPFHLACYKSSKDVRAVIHVHSPYSIAASERVTKLPVVSYEFECLAGGPVPVLEYIDPGSEALASAIGEEISKGAAVVLMKKHGAVSVGKDLEDTYLKIMALERACKAFVHSG